MRAPSRCVPLQAREKSAMVGCRADVAVDPRGEALALARDRVPLEVEVVVARVVAVRVDGQAPPGQCEMAVTVKCGSTTLFMAGGSSSTIFSTVTSSLPAASAASRAAPTMPSIATLPRLSARWACRMVTSGFTAGTVAIFSPV